MSEEYVYHLQVNLVKVKCQTSPEDPMDRTGKLVRQCRTYNYANKETSVLKMEAIMELVEGFRRHLVSDFVLPEIEF